MEFLRKHGDRVAVAAFAVILLAYGAKRWSGWETETKFRDDLRLLLQRIGSLDKKPAEPPVFGSRSSKGLESRARVLPGGANLNIRDVINHPVPVKELTNGVTTDNGTTVKPPPDLVTVPLVRGARDPVRVEPKRAIKSWTSQSPLVKIEEPPEAKGRWFFATALGEKGQEVRIQAETDGKPVIFIFPISEDVRLPDIGKIDVEPSEGRATVRWTIQNGGADAGLKGFYVERALVYHAATKRASEWTRLPVAGSPGGFVPAVAGAKAGSFADAELAARTSYHWRVCPVASPLGGPSGERLGSWSESAVATTPEEVRLSFRSMGVSGETRRGQFRVEKFFRDRMTWGKPREFWVDVLSEKGGRSGQVGEVVKVRDVPGKPPVEWDYSTGWVLLEIIDERISQPPRQEPKIGPDGKPVFGPDGKPLTTEIPQTDKRVVSAILLDPEEEVVRLEINASTTGRPVPSGTPTHVPPPGAERAPLSPERAAGRPADFYWIQIEEIVSDRYTLVDGGGARAIVAALENVAAFGFEKRRILKAKIVAGDSTLRSPTSLKDVKFRTIREWSVAPERKIDKVLVSGKWNTYRFHSVKIVDVLDGKRLVLEDAAGARAILESGVPITQHGFLKNEADPAIVEARIGERTAEVMSIEEHGRRVPFQVVSGWR